MTPAHITPLHEFLKHFPSSAHPASVARRLPEESGSQGSGGAQPARARVRGTREASRDSAERALVPGGYGRVLVPGMEVGRFVRPLLEAACVAGPERGECRARTEAARDMEAPERGRGSRRAAAPAAGEQQPFPARAGGRVAAAEQDGAHLRGRGRRGHAGGLLRRRAPLSALLPDYWTGRISSGRALVRPD